MHPPNVHEQKEVSWLAFDDIVQISDCGISIPGRIPTDDDHPDLAQRSTRNTTTIPDHEQLASTYLALPSITMNVSKRSKFHLIWDDIKTYRNAYILTLITAFGGMLFGWDTGLIGGVLTMKPFQQSFDLKNTTLAEKKAFSDLSGNIVSILQAGCFFGAMSSFYISDRFGRRSALMLGASVFLLGSTIQTCSGLNTTSLGLLYAGRVVGGFGVGLISAVVPTYIGENANKEIRGRCIGTMQLFNV